MPLGHQWLSHAEPATHKLTGRAQRRWYAHALTSCVASERRSCASELVGKGAGIVLRRLCTAHTCNVCTVA